MWSLMGKGSSTLGSFILAVLLARLVSKEDFGLYMLALSIVSVIAMAFHLGLPTASVKLISEAYSRASISSAKSHASGLTLLGVACAIIAAIATKVIVFPAAANAFSKPELMSLAFLASLWVFGLIIQTTIGETYRGLHMLPHATVFGGTFFAVAIIAIISALGLSGALSRMPLHIAVAATVSVLILNGIIAFSVAIKTYLTKPIISLKDIRTIGSLSLSFGIIQLAIFIFSQSDIWAIGYLFDANQLAAYVAAAKLAGLIAVPALVVNTAILQIIPEVNTRGDRDEMKTMMQGSAGLSAILALPVGVLFVFFGFYAMRLIYGEDYLDSVPILGILTFARFFSVWTGPCGLVLMLIGGQWEMVRISLVVGSIVVILIFVMAPVTGMIGVATIVAFGYVALNLWAMVSIKQRTGLWSFATYEATTAILPSFKRKINIF